MKTDSTSTFLCSRIFIDIQIINSVPPNRRIFCALIPNQDARKTYIRVVNTSSMPLLLKLDYFFQNYPSLSNSHNEMLKYKMIVQKSAVTTQYGSGGAPKKVESIP